ncbi:MAG: glycosyltransferase [Raoultibacter sp.]
MQRILHVIGAMDRGGAETILMNLYRCIDRNRVQFDFLVHEPTRTCDYDEEIERLGGRLYRLDRFVGYNYFSYRKACRDFFAQHPEYSVVQGHIGSCAALYLAEAKRAGCYTIAHSHAQNFPLSLSQLGFRALSFPTRYIADYFMACSLEAGRDRFGKAVVAGDRFKVLKNGIDLGCYTCDEVSHRQAKNALGWGDVPVFGHVGRLAVEKNHVFLLQVFQQIKKQLPSAVLVLVGRGPLEEDLKGRVAHQGLEESVFFFSIRDDVPEILKALDVFVFPSIIEGLSMASIEAQAVGLPCILSTGVPEAAVITQHAQRLALEAGADLWAQTCVAAYQAGSVRHDCTDEVRAAGFAIDDAAAWLCAFYEKARPRCKKHS